jgi:hypothetical protein
MNPTLQTQLVHPVPPSHCSGRGEGGEEGGEESGEEGEKWEGRRRKEGEG